MRVSAQLISMPLAPPGTPSIQLACLKAHLDRAFGRRDFCRAHSAFFSILHDFKGRAFQSFFRDVRGYREHLYLPLYLRRFGPAEFRHRPAQARLLQALRTRRLTPLSPRTLRGLELATCRFLEGPVARGLISRGVNVVGFTLSFPQVYASLYAAEHLRRRHPERRFLFVFGGAAASLPAVYGLLRGLGVAGVVVVGEGEKKLELLVRTLQGLPPARARDPLAAVRGLDPGIVVIGEAADLDLRDPARHATQVEELDGLALPDYGEYFAAVRSACADAEAYAAFCAGTEVLVEGSRGCFCRCDFCGLNRLWHGFRTRSADQVLRTTLALTRRYRTSRVVFVDNVCDAWAGDYARMLVRGGIRQRMFMELRADHPEPFWTLLSLAGVEGVQVGVEALSAPLLRAIGKGTRVIHNLAAQKYLSELGIFPNNLLITHHPASTLADVRETRRILAQVPHWSAFYPNEFLLEPGSRLFAGLGRHARASLKQTRAFRLPPGADRYALEYTFEIPASLRPPRDVTRAWSAFTRQYEGTLARHEASQPRLEVARVAPDMLRVTDTRSGRVRVHDFSGDAAKIYDACHAGLTLGGISRATGLSTDAVRAGLARFVRLKLVLRVEEWHLSLALRPRDELLRRFFAAPEAPQVKTGGRGVRWRAAARGARSSGS
jgi:radical SAM superfamily enzyme YgiQ (UPF0313 family)